MSDSKVLYFPSSLSIDRAKKRAKAAVKAGEFPTLTQALDAIARAEMGIPWGKAIAALKSRQQSPITQFMTVRDIQAVMGEIPSLTHFGFGAYRDRSKSYKDYLRDVEKEKESLLGAVDECNKACMYLQHLEKRKTINGNSSTYGLKHSVEHYMRNLQGIEDYYVANGAFMCAAHFMGFKIEQGINGSPNGFINYSERSPIIKWRKLSEQRMISTKLIRELNQLETDLGLPSSSTVEHHSYLLK